MTNLNQGTFLIRIANQSLWEFLAYDRGHIAHKAKVTSFMGNPDKNDDTRNEDYILVKKIGFDSTNSREEWLSIDEFRRDNQQ
jgi:hypothetical protein